MQQNNSDEEFVQARAGLYQTEPMRLQLEANNYTKKVEHERKKLMILTDNYRQTQEQLQEIKAKIDEKIGESQQSDDTAKEDAKQASMPKSGAFHERLYPNPKKVKTEDQEKAGLKSLKHKLEHEKVLLNNIKGDNKDLRVRITSMRYEIIFAQETIRRMEEAI